MPNSTQRSGSKNEFRANWSSRKESQYNHWTKGSPTNQVQFAFRNHWEVFSALMGNRPPGVSLEVGCGRGSLSSYFAANGWQTSLLDFSPEVIDIAAKIFETNAHKGHFVTGDANDLPFEDNSFDTVSSIGLLEHFEDASITLQEQWRVLKPGGWIFAYIVPERPNNVQKYFRWLNTVLKHTVGRLLAKKDSVQKQDIYRNDYTSNAYLPVVEKFSPNRIVVTGMYSMPMISHSPEFPFSLLPPAMEKVLVALFGAAVTIRKHITSRHGWLCSEPMGQAFLIAIEKRTTSEDR